jgi:integrase
MVRANTFANYELMVRVHLVPGLGARSLQKLTPAHVSGFYGDLLDGRTAKGTPLGVKSVRNIHAILRKALGDAAEWGYMTRNPAERVKVPRAPRANQHAAKYQTWTQTEVRRFLAHVEDDELYSLWTLAATTGMRRSELLGLRWRDIDLDGSRLSVVQTLVMVKGELIFGEPKTKRSARVVHLDAGTVAVLRRHRIETLERGLQTGTPVPDLVFTLDDEPIRPSLASRRFPKLAQQAGLPRIRFHDLRHTWATLALANGIHPKIVSERLGHSSIAITLDTYSHVTGTLQADAAEQVASLLFPAVDEPDGDRRVGSLGHLEGTPTPIRR